MLVARRTADRFRNHGRKFIDRFQTFGKNPEKPRSLFGEKVFQHGFHSLRASEKNTNGIRARGKTIDIGGFRWFTAGRLPDAAFQPEEEVEEEEEEEEGEWKKFKRISEVTEEDGYFSDVYQGVNLGIGGFVEPIDDNPFWKALEQCGESDEDFRVYLKYWLREGNDISKEEYEDVMRRLMRDEEYELASDVSSWLLGRELFEFDEDNYVSYLQCISKADDIAAIELAFQKLPTKMKGVKPYRVLLKKYVIERNLEKVDVVFRSMKKAGFELDVGDYNLMLLAYLSRKRNIPKLLKQMETLNIKRDINTYKILFYSKSMVNDIGGREELAEKMRADGLEPNADILIVLAKHFIKSVMVGKAEETISELEKLSNLEQESSAKRHRILRKLFWYSVLLNKENDAERHWKELEADTDIPLRSYIVGILGWGKLGKIEKAEKIFASLLESPHPITAEPYSALLQVYADHKLQSKAEELLEQMSHEGIAVNRAVKSSLVRLYVNLDDLENAESLLSYEDDDMKTRPDCISFLLVLRKYAENGDIDNAERIFYTMRKAGYTGRYAMYEAILNAHIKANAPADGMEIKMMADRFIPDQKIDNLLQKVNELQKIPSAELAVTA